MTNGRRDRHSRRHHLGGVLGHPRARLLAVTALLAALLLGPSPGAAATPSPDLPTWPAVLALGGTRSQVERSRHAPTRTNEPPRLDIAMPLWDAPGALVPVIVTLHHPPPATDILLTGEGRRGATVTCLGPAWHNRDDDTLSRECYVLLPLTGDRFPLHGVATVTHPDGSRVVLDQQASRNLRSLGPASPEPLSILDARRVERCGNPTDDVWLTFDDGATAAGLRSILATLERNHVRGRFFLRGDWAVVHPDLMRRITQSGHLLGDHTYRHLPLNRETDGVVRSQVHRGVRPTTVPPLLRPPGGAAAFSTRLRDLATADGMAICRWTTDTYDWTGASAARITERVRTGDAVTPPVRPGGVILMHGYGAHTAEALQGVIDAVRARGLALDPLR